MKDCQTFRFTYSTLLLGLALPLSVACSDDGGVNDEVGTTDTSDTTADTDTTSETGTTSDTTGETADTTDTGEQPPAHCPDANAWAGPSDDGNDFAVIQGLFSDANEGDVLCLEAGTYAGLTDEIIVSVNGVTIVGAGQDETVLDFVDQSEGGNGIKVVADGVTFRDLQVKNTPGDGIRGDQVDDITFERVTVQWEAADLTTHGAYGLYPVGCNNVSILESTVIGSRDAGHYVGQSTHIVVRDSVAFQNVAGVEIENSYDAWVFDNEAYENTAGLLVFDLPGLEQGDGGNTRFYNNNIHNNNFENFAIGGTVAQVPSGSGVVVLAANNIEIDHNIIDDHRTLGVLIVHYAELLFGAVEDPNFDVWNRGIHVHDNTFSNVGYDPEMLIASFLQGMPGPDVFWDGARPECADTFQPGEEICVHDNTSDDADNLFNLDLCQTFGGPNTDLAAVDCVGVTLPDWPG